MNCTFRILWFEDEITWFRMEQMRVNDILHEHYLEPDITRKNGDDFELPEICGNCFDLILMDFKLAAGITGETIVSAIRKNNILTDILFYSSEEDAMLTAIYSSNPPIDGIYFTLRDFEVFTEKVKGLINKIVKRSEDLINLRGFVMDNSCDFEVRIQEILNVAWTKFSTKEKAILEEAVKHTIDFDIKRQKKNIEKVIAKDPVFPVAVNDVHCFSHSDRLYILTKVIGILEEDYGFQPKLAHANFKVNYENDISHYRNALGHRKSGENTIEIMHKIVPIDEALHKLMRKNLNEYNALIEGLEIYVVEQI